MMFDFSYIYKMMVLVVRVFGVGALDEVPRLGVICSILKRFDQSS